MKTKQGIRYAIVTAFLAATAVSGVAMAVDEVEPNYPIQSPQRLIIGNDRSVTVTGIIGVLSGTAVGDADIYSFYAQAGDVLVVDIDGGMKMAGTPGRSVNTSLVVLGPSLTSSSNCNVLRENLDSSLVKLDDGSVHKRDPYIDNLLVQVTGIHYVGVTSHPRRMVDCGAVVDTENFYTNGDYTLIISGVTPSVLQISIEIRPGSGTVLPINPKARGSIPVALLSTDGFDARTVKRESLRFGRTGDEGSLQRCDKGVRDVNGDGRLDLVCLFENEQAKFDPDSVEGVLTGATADGTPFEGRGVLKVLPARRAED